MEWVAILLLAGGVFAYFRFRRKPLDLSILPEQFVVVDLACIFHSVGDFGTSAGKWVCDDGSLWLAA
jgi:hypothetical protein